MESNGPAPPPDTEKVIRCNQTTVVRNARARDGQRTESKWVLSARNCSAIRFYQPPWLIGRVSLRQRLGPLTDS